MKTTNVRVLLSTKISYNLVYAKGGICMHTPTIDLRLLKECFWDYDFTLDDIVKMSVSDDWREKVFLFEKILLNSTKMIKDLKLFKPTDLEQLLENYKVPQFNKEYVFKRKNIADVYFLGKEVLVNELKWVA